MLTYIGSLTQRAYAAWGFVKDAGVALVLTAYLFIAGITLPFAFIGLTAYIIYGKIKLCRNVQSI